MPDLNFTCPNCSQQMAVPAETAEVGTRCPACGQEVRAAAAVVVAPVTSPAPDAPSRKCAICLSPVLDSETKHTCPACAAEYHADCWEENGGCAIYGCSQVPVIEKRQAIDIPVSYWGQENKQCPNCHREILAAAVRCRYCGATFESARPQDISEFQQRGELKLRLPAARRTVIWLFVFSVLPCLAPIGAVWGAVWVPNHREEVRALPSLYGALCKIGLVVAIGQTVLMVLLTLLFSLVHH